MNVTAQQQHDLDNRNRLEREQLREKEKDMLAFVKRAEEDKKMDPASIKARADSFLALDELCVSLSIGIPMSKAIAAYIRIRSGRNINKNLDMDNLPFKLIVNLE